MATSGTSRPLALRSIVHQVVSRFRRLHDTVSGRPGCRSLVYCLVTVRGVTLAALVDAESARTFNNMTTLDGVAIYVPPGQ